jgi:sugar/nucleoside kinase (ribokinase family)
LKTEASSRSESEANILAVGSVAFDTVEAPGGRVVEGLGGSATYFALAASLFAPVAVVAVVGDDFPDEAVQIFFDRGVDCAGLERREGRTFRWCGRYEEDVNVAITEKTELGVFGEFRPVVPESCRDHPYVALGNIDPLLQLAVLEQLNTPRFVAVDTMNFWIDRQRDDLAEVIARADVLVVNDAEAKMLGGEANLIGAITRLLELGPRYVLAKKGEHGAVLMARDFEFILPAFPLRDGRGRQLRRRLSGLRRGVRRHVARQPLPGGGVRRHRGLLRGRGPGHKSAGEIVPRRGGGAP